MFIGTNYFNYNNYSTLFGLNNARSGSTAVSSLQQNMQNILESAGTKLSGVKNSSALGNIQDLKGGASSLKNALRSLSDGGAYRKTAVSSDSDKVSVRVDNKAYGSFKDTTIKVSQLAAGQKNEGASLQSNAAAQSGYHQFEIETNGTRHQFSVSLSASDTNETMQQKMADAINARNIGVTAAVSKNEINGTSSLAISAGKTGDAANAKFSIRDVAGSAVSKTGVSTVTQQAQNAIYSINGGASRESLTNEVSLGGGVTATLKKASDEAVSISSKKDASTAISKVKDMVDGYNRVLSGVVENGDDERGYRLFSRMLSVSKTYMAELGKIGVEFDADGYMSINDTKIKEAGENGSLERFFTENRGKNYGFTNQLSRIADDVNQNAARYVSKSVMEEAGFDYGSYGKLFGKSNLYAAGLLFDMMF
ncbi:hypothetical protein LJC34_04210 [Oscillospiraceae bacterium OttesenSCG-928-G22]|nr:hypothetical protein [Oscillospiraceae bacterium OttesenSCG-928-G22]